MKFCTECGTQLHDDDFFCTNCGNQVPLPEIQEKSEVTKVADNTNNYNEFEIQNSQSATTNSVQDNIKTRFLNHKKILIIIAIILLIPIVTVICLKQIPYKSFDIKDKELIEILNDCGSYTSQSPLELDTFDPDTTVYRITGEDETGLLVLSHSFSGHIRCIMVCFEDNDVYSAAIISAIASELDYSFSASKAMNTLLLDDEIYSSNKYSAIAKELSSDLTCVFLAPNKNFEYCVKSVLPN
ncbi:MAG: zinc ribbon domain-containing protein [Clostridiales bacterium]|nr:zinc ribbon domain-containing protein [Clostridiales bacterium]